MVRCFVQTLGRAGYGQEAITDTDMGRYGLTLVRGPSMSTASPMNWRTGLSLMV